MRKDTLRRFPLCAAVFAFGGLLLAPAAGRAIPTCGCYCPTGGAATLYQTTWGAAPAYTCSDLVGIGYSAASQYADSQCDNGVCALTFSNESCVDPGLTSQHYDLQFRYKCTICLNPCP